MDEKAYTTQGIVVYYRSKLCIHAAECVRGLGQVFDPAKRPWIQPQHATPQELAQVIERCPSGALRYERLDGAAAEAASAGLQVQFVENGPAYLRGALQLSNDQGQLLYQGTRAALCRCGQSANKPFCDNSHLKGFSAPPAQIQVNDG